MSNSNKHIEEFLNYYLEHETSPDYAVLITGCWGSGKTYFIRQYLGGNRKEVKDWLTDCEKYTVVYVSLFGAKSRDEMDKRVLETLHPKLNSKIVKAIPGAVSLIGKIAGTATANPFETIAGENIAIFTENFLEAKKNAIKKVVVVFDDVERADMPLPELLGYLNEYVEHLHVPCILLADKEKWEEAQKCQEDKSTLHHLSSTKEKVIGKQFQIQTTFDEVWNCWFNEEHHILGDDTFVFLKDYRDTIASLFDASKTSNYRSLKHSLFDFQRFIEKIEKRNLTESEFNSLLVADFMTHQYAYYLGLLNPYEMTTEISSSVSRISKILNKNQIGTDLRIQTNPLTNNGGNVTWSIVPCNQNNQEKLTNYEHFQKIFNCVNKFTSLGDSFFANKWLQIWQTWLLNNHADYDEINHIIRESIWYEGGKEFYLRKMLNWFMLDDESGEKALKAFECSLKDESLVDPFLIMDLFYRIYWYSQQGAMRYTPEEFKSKMEEYVVSIKTKLIDRDMKDWKSRGWVDDSYKQNEKENEAFRLLLANLLNEKIKDRNENAKNEFYTLLSSGSYNDMKRACDRISLYLHNSEKFHFKELDVKKMCSTYHAMKNSWHSYFFEALEDRYKRQENANEWNVELINSEEDFLTDLLCEAERIYKEADRPISPSVFAFYYLIRTIKKILGGKENVA